MEKSNTYILGAGVTGLACGYSTGFTVFEKQLYSGGICSSYYIAPPQSLRMTDRKNDQEDYRFEYGGGHWIFGQDDAVHRFLSQFDTLQRYYRKSSVYFKQFDCLVPYPIQNNLRYLPLEVSKTIIEEIIHRRPVPVETMYEWCEDQFGSTLSTLFFHPFHKMYTAGLWKHIAPQDGYKTPLDIQSIVEGATSRVAPAGYNVSFVYPKNGLNALTSQMQHSCDIRFNAGVSQINIQNKQLTFFDGSTLRYDRLISTLPLNTMQNMTGISVESRQDPYTSVIVLNIGARKGLRDIEDHWIYFPNSASGFHRIGFYNNVDPNFLPVSKRTGDYVSLYVEKSFVGGASPSQQEIDTFAVLAVKELQDLGFIAEIDVIDPTWIDVAYTWNYPGSRWKEDMISMLRQNDIYPIGRYATWKFQGILDSIKGGLDAGTLFKSV